MPGNDEEHPVILCALTIASLAFMIPGMQLHLSRGRKRIFDFWCAFGLYLTSNMYHLSDSLNTNRLGLSEQDWHRADNIFVISVYANVCVNLCTLEERVASHMKHAILLITILTQLHDPWNVLYTAVPIVAYTCVIFIVQLSRRKPFSAELYDKKRVLQGMLVLILIAGPAFVFGLDDENDVYRLWHWLFHVAAGIVFWLLENAVYFSFPADEQRTVRKSESLAR